MSASIGFFILVFLTDAAKYGRHKGNEVEWRLAGWPRWVARPPRQRVACSSLGALRDQLQRHEEDVSSSVAQPEERPSERQAKGVDLHGEAVWQCRHGGI